MIFLAIGHQARSLLAGTTGVESIGTDPHNGKHPLARAGSAITAPSGGVAPVRLPAPTDGPAAAVPSAMRRQRT